MMGVLLFVMVVVVMLILSRLLVFCSLEKKLMFGWKLFSVLLDCMVVRFIVVNVVLVWVGLLLIVMVFL